MLNLADNHGITLIPTYKHTHLNVEAECLPYRKLAMEWQLLCCIAQMAFQLSSQPDVNLLASLHTNESQH